jgi:hypothetical protein
MNLPPPQPSPCEEEGMNPPPPQPSPCKGEGMGDHNPSFLIASLPHCLYFTASSLS